MNKAATLHQAGDFSFLTNALLFGCAIFVLNLCQAAFSSMVHTAASCLLFSQMALKSSYCFLLAALRLIHVSTKSRSSSVVSPKRYFTNRSSLLWFKYWFN